MRPRAADAALALRVVSRRPRHRQRLLRSVDVGHDDALHAAVEEAQDGRRLVVGHTGQRGEAEGLGGSHEVLDLVQGHGPVLAVDHHEVEAQRPGQF